MFSRVFKNHNVTIRRDLMEEGVIVRDVLHLVELMENDLDAPDVAPIVGGPSVHHIVGGRVWGSSVDAPVVEASVALMDNGDPDTAFWYCVTMEDVDTFNAGKTARLIATDPAPHIYMPDYLEAYPLEVDGTAGRLYKFDRHAAPSDGFMDDVQAIGGRAMHTRAQYAPELVSPAVWIPRGMRVWPACYA